MKQEGYEAVRSGGRRGYRVVELKGDEIYRNQCAMARNVGDCFFHGFPKYLNISSTCREVNIFWEPL